MPRNIFKQTALAIAISASAIGVAMAQPAGSQPRNSADSTETSGKIISDQTQTPNTELKDQGAEANRSAEGAGASQKSAGKIISDQTQSTGKAPSATSGEAMKGDPSTKTSADIIKNETEAPGRTGTTGQPPRSTSSGATK